MSLVVVGTGTGVGKTLVSAVLALRYRVAYWKPVASGLNGESGPGDNDTVQELCGGHVPIWPSRYTYAPPVSPHLAGRLADDPVDLAQLHAAWRRRPQQPAIVEGIGGVLVPLNDRGELFADWMAQLGLPCVVVASSELGTINHTLLTLEALRGRGIGVAGVVLSGAANAENAAAIATFGQTPLIDRVDWLPSLSFRSVAAAAERFDRAGALAPLLTHASNS